MTLEQQLAEQAKRGLLGLGFEEETAEEYAPWASLLAQFLPGVGEGVGIDNTVDAINDERYGDAAIEGGLTLLGAVPVVGDMAAAAIKGIRKAPIKAFDEAAWLKENPRPEGPRKSKEVNAWHARKDYAKNRQKRLDQKKVYQSENAEAISERERLFRERNAERLRQERKIKYAENVEAERAKNAANYKRNAEKRKKWQREYRERKADEVRAANKKWRDENADMLAAQRASPEGRARSARITAKRRSAMLDRLPAWADPDRIDEIYRTAADISAETGIPHHVDHVIPLQGRNVSGLHHQDNLLIVPGAENLSKNNKFEPGDLPPRAGVRKSRAYLKKIREAKEKAKR